MSDDQFDKLYKAIERQSKIMDRQFETTDKKYNDQFGRLFKYMERRFKVIEDRLDLMVTKAEFKVFADAVDAFAKRMETYDHERLALGHQVDRHEKWHHQTAKAVGLNLQT